MSSKDIGIPGVTPPKVRECADQYCPFHSTIRIRGKVMDGIVVSMKSTNTAVIRQDYVHFVRKFQRYERRNSRIAAHVPECLSDVIKIGDLVRIGECRKISKNKSFIVLDKMKGREEM